VCPQVIEYMLQCNEVEDEGVALEVGAPVMTRPSNALSCRPWLILGAWNGKARVLCVCDRCDL